MSAYSFDLGDISYIQERVMNKYGLNIHFINQIDRSFERALSLCLFGNEHEVDSISSTLHNENDW